MANSDCWRIVIGFQHYADGLASPQRSDGTKVPRCFSPKSKPRLVSATSMLFATKIATFDDSFNARQIRPQAGK
jgi:hypothetical protein